MKILIVKTSSIGDIIQALPILEYLKKRVPEASIDWVCQKESYTVLRAHPFINRIWLFKRPKALSRHFIPETMQFVREMRANEYEFLFDLQGNTKSAWITLLARAKHKVGWGWKSVAEIPNIFVLNRRIEVDPSIQIQTRYVQLLQQFFACKNPFHPTEIVLSMTTEEERRLNTIPLLGDRLHYMVACFSRWPNKQIGINILTQFLHRIAIKDNPIFHFVWGNRGERDIIEGILPEFPDAQSIGELSFPLWQAVMRKMNLVIAVDSCASALCGTTQTPSFSIFGPSSAAVYTPIGKHHTSFQGTCPYGISFQSRCPFLRTCRTGACLKSLTPDQLFAAYLNLTQPNNSEVR